MNTLLGKKILVTGGAGFIGSFVVSELLKEDVSKVVIFDNFSRGSNAYIEEQLKDPRCSFVQGDLREIDVLNAAMNKCNYVVHLAAMWLLHCKDFPRTAFDVNIQGTFNVLEACVKNNIERLVYSSSASVYGDAVNVPMTEDHLLKQPSVRAYHDDYPICHTQTYRHHIELFPQTNLAEHSCDIVGIERKCRGYCRTETQRIRRIEMAIFFGPY